MHVGTLIRYRLRLHGIPVSWLTRIEEWDPPRGFVDMQISGPYGLWHHTHTFEALADGRTQMTDTVRYGHRFGPLGTLAQRLLVRRDVERIFDYRRDEIAKHLGSGTL
jgi:ligand-binding SRPBCC domain-containing protein